jgi:predicted O-methyltransferase YrrM
MQRTGLSFDHNKPLPETLETVIGSSASAWALPTEMARILAHLILQITPSSVLEYGSGQSSVVLAAALAESGGGMLTSIDHAT